MILRLIPIKFETLKPPTIHVSLDLHSSNLLSLSPPTLLCTKFALSNSETKASHWKKISGTTLPGDLANSCPIEAG